MFKFARAGGVAAAAVALAASLSLADPSQATEAVGAVEALPSYLAHANAGNDAAGMIADTAATGVGSLPELVATYAASEVADAEQDCLANAVYFEARGEPIEGQLAVADVVLNRAASGKYPATICEVVTQPWQFSFVRRGIIPAADRTSEAWRKAVAISEIALRDLDAKLPKDVLWYHADYVSPSWGKRLKRQTKIGLHIFYS